MKLVAAQVNRSSERSSLVCASNKLAKYTTSPLSPRRDPPAFSLLAAAQRALYSSMNRKAADALTRYFLLHCNSPEQRYPARFEVNSTVPPATVCEILQSNLPSLCPQQLPALAKELHLNWLQLPVSAVPRDFALFHR